MFENLDDSYKYYIYQGLKLLVEKGEGIGFHNHDRGHPAYIPPFQDTNHNDTNLGDGSESNQLFQMLKSLSESLMNTVYSQETKWVNFSDWETFCKFAVECHEHARNNQ